MFSCTRDLEVEMMSECDESPITYIGHIKVIIDTKCSYSGCHDTAGTAPGNYTQYIGINLATSSGQFDKRVFSDANTGFSMPPPTVVQSQELSEDEMLLLRCWAQDGYLEQ